MYQCGSSTGWLSIFVVLECLYGYKWVMRCALPSCCLIQSQSLASPNISIFPSSTSSLSVFMYSSWGREGGKGEGEVHYLTELRKL